MKQTPLPFFYWQRTTTGKWTPVKAIDRPGKRAESKGPRTSPVIELDPDLRTLTLKQLAMIYPAPDDPSARDKPPVLDGEIMND